MSTQSSSWIPLKKLNPQPARLAIRMIILLTTISTAVKLAKSQRPKWLSSSRLWCLKRFRPWASSTRRRKKKHEKVNFRMERFLHLLCTKNWITKSLQARNTSKKFKIWLGGNKNSTTWVTTLLSTCPSCWIKNTGGSKILEWVSKTST